MSQALEAPSETRANVVPFNLQKQNASDEKISQAVDYAISVANNYAMWLAGFGEREFVGVPCTFDRHSILDVGPGPTLGAAVLMACAGARVTVADLDLVSWDPDFHSGFYACLFDRLKASDSRYLSPLRRVIEAEGFDPSVVTMLNESAETLNRTKGIYDLIFSNSTFEHVENVPAAIRSLWSVTPPGGLGFHHIDFRDHRNFADPLRYLTIDQRTFTEIQRGPMGNFGTRLRVQDFVRSFEAEGFLVTGVYPDQQRADAEYLAALRPHLDADFKDRTDAELGVLGALVVVKRPA